MQQAEPNVINYAQTNLAFQMKPAGHQLFSQTPNTHLAGEIAVW